MPNVLSNTAQQGKGTGKASCLADKDVKRRRRKKRRHGQAEGDRLQTNPPQRKATQRTSLWKMLLSRGKGQVKIQTHIYMLPRVP